jgi:MinD superfamily P-loop ATPase
MTPEDSPGKVSVTSSSEDSIIDESKTLFLGDLQPNTKEAAELVTALFPSSDVSHIDVKVVNSNKGCLCYAFVSRLIAAG